MQSNRTLIVDGLVRPILGDIVLPYMVYVIAHRLGLSTLLALMLGGVWFLARFLVSVVRGRRIDRLALFVLMLVVAGMAASLVSGSARLAVVKDSAFTGVVGLFFIGTRVTGRSIMATAFRRLVMGNTEGGTEIWNGIWERSAVFRRLFHRLDTTWGIGLLVEAGTRVIAALTMPLSTVITLSPVLMGVTVILLASWNGVQGKALGRLLRAEGLVPAGMPNRKTQSRQPGSASETSAQPGAGRGEE